MDVFLTLSPGTYDFFLVGGGASGKFGRSAGMGMVGSGGGGSGYTKTYKGLVIASEHPYVVVIGAGGEESVNQSGPIAHAGSATSISGKELPDEMLVVSGGKAETTNVNKERNGTDGGSGGGGSNSGKAGSNGSPGYSSTGAATSNGQGTTTKAFGEESGTLYAGAGGGGGANHTDNSGKGGGGNGQYNDGLTAHSGTAGTPNTGGGGGGGADENPTNFRTGLKGGSGLIIIRWNNG